MLKKIILVLITLVFFTKCLVLNKYSKSDKDLSDHYKNITIKPSYKSLPFLKRKIHYAVVSKNDSLPLLVFVHGAPGAWYGYMNLMDDTLLQNKYKMVSVDRLGYGKSGYGNAELSIEKQALSIDAIIQKENTANKKVVLFGRSYGAPITALLAIEHPENIDRLYMISPVIDPEKEKFYWFSKAGTWKAVQWLLPEMLNVATAEKYAHQGEMKKMLPRWKDLCIPTTVITGETDHIADTANFTFAKRHLINCDTTLIKLKNTGHLVTMEQPELIKKLLLNPAKEKNTKVFSRR
jgi:pimeloyl-ACP methyl ester carboxylesterase